MNNTELDEMLNQWDTPPVPPALRDRVRAGFESWRNQPRRRRFAWPSWHVGKGLFAGIAAAAVLFVVVMAQAFPQSFGLGPPSPALQPPYVVVSNVFAYESDGSSRIDAQIRSTSYKGMEIVLDEKHPDNPIEEFLKNFHNGMHLTLLRYVPGVVLPESSARDARFSSYVQSGCVEQGEVLIGHDTILGHATNVLQRTYPNGGRWTVWKAPDMGCFGLRSKSEEPAAGGTLRLARERDAVQVLIALPASPR
jgi:hypothetical protein